METPTNDGQTLFVRFRKQFPCSEDEVRNLHPSILTVKVPRRGKKGDLVKNCLLRFETKEIAKQAKTSIVDAKFKGENVFVTVVKAKKESKVEKLNPCKLLVSGLTPGVTNVALKSMFPKASYAEISNRSRKKGSKYGFVSFDNPKDARATFDAAQNLDVEGHKITVLYAKDKGASEEYLKKRKANEEKMAKSKKAKMGDEEKLASDGENEAESDANDEESDDNDEESDANDEESDNNDEESDDNGEEDGDNGEEGDTEDEDEEEDDDSEGDE